MLNAPQSRPKAKSGTYAAALELIGALGAKPDVKKWLGELSDAEAAHDAARDAAVAAAANATEREKSAQSAEAKATVARQKLADETAQANTELSRQRSDAEIEAKRLSKLGTDLDERLQDIERRERLLKLAGVVFAGDE